MNNIKITPDKGMTILLFALVLFCTKANAQVMAFGMLHSNEAATTPLPAVPSVLSITGKIWMDRNLGATRRAQSKDDYLAYGDLYQWGRATDGHEKINWDNGAAGVAANGTTSTKADSPANALFITSSSDWREIPNAGLWDGVDGINNPCPSGYRLPTNKEITDELAPNSITDSASAFASIFRFTVPGSRGHSNGNIEFTGSNGNYWTSSVNDTRATYRNFAVKTALVHNVRSLGFAVRCIKN